MAFSGCLSEDEEAQLARSVSQDRSALIFCDYEMSTEGRQRRDALGPLLVHRDDWLSHPGWKRRPQMPSFHVKFRMGMQQTLRILSDWYASSSRDPKPAEEAGRHFGAVKTVLNGHVRIEETHVFPQLQNWHPRVDTTFLYVDHARLHELEETVTKNFKSIQTAALYGHIDREDKADLLRSVLAFDKCLMTHLGEEEDIVVPLTLNAPE
jgi:hypothetical protein